MKTIFNGPEYNKIRGMIKEIIYCYNNGGYNGQVKIGNKTILAKTINNNNFIEIRVIESDPSYFTGFFDKNIIPFVPKESYLEKIISKAIQG